MQREELQFRAMVNASSPGAMPNTQWILSDPSTWVRTAYDRDDFTVRPDSGSTSTNTTDSFYISNQLSFFEGRLRTLAGMRVDDFEVTAYNAGTGSVTTDTAEPARVPQAGVLYKFTDDLSVYATYSESFLPIFSTSRRPDGSYYSPVPQTGEGMDLGVKGNLFEGKVNYTAAIYEVSNTNIVRNLPQVTIDTPQGQETFSPTNQSGKETSRGFEFDMRWRPTNETQFIFSYGYTDAWVASDPQSRVTLPDGTVLLTRQGNRLGHSPEHTAAAFLRQGFGDVGVFSRVYATIGGRMISDYKPADIYSVIGGQLVEPVDYSGYATVDLGVGASVKIMDHAYSLSLNVKNALDESYRPNRWRYAPGREFFFRLSTRF